MNRPCMQLTLSSCSVNFSARSHGPTSTKRRVLKKSFQINANTQNLAIYNSQTTSLSQLDQTIASRWTCRAYPLIVFGLSLTSRYRPMLFSMNRRSRNGSGRTLHGSKDCYIYLTRIMGGKYPYHVGAGPNFQKGYGGRIQMDGHAGDPESPV